MEPKEKLPKATADVVITNVKSDDGIEKVKKKVIMKGEDDSKGLKFQVVVSGLDADISNFLAGLRYTKSGNIITVQFSNNQTALKDFE